ncbi:MAG: RAMP superfamily CRISPR-associated protein, partial [Planctomycetota bacterium]
MIRRIHALFLPLRFPAGIAPGEGGDYNVLMVARNGDDRPVLRGTAIAGALRHVWVRHLQDRGLHKAEITRQERRFFGWALESRSEDDDWTADEGARRSVESLLQVSDTVMNQSQKDVVTRTHHSRNRHTGVVMDSALFSLECCPPGSTATVALWLREPGPDSNDAEVSTPEEEISFTEFLDVIVDSLERGLTLGGNSARGIGMVELDRKETRYKTYDLSDVNQYAKFLDDHLTWRLNSDSVPVAGPFPASDRDTASSTTLEVDFCLSIPRGQDLLIGDGQGLDHEMEPQRVVRADGTQCWRLPGGSLRGVFRAWATRLAARNPLFKNKVADSAGAYFDQPASKKGKPPRVSTLNKEQQEKHLNCPINQLFGSVLAAGRIHISDADAPCLPKTKVQIIKDGKPVETEIQPEEQLRMHVAVDRLTGGAAESLLGTHDFAAFRAVGCSAPTTRRRIDKLAVHVPAEYLAEEPLVW